MTKEKKYDLTTQLREADVDFDVAAEAAFRQMWEQIHETITDANFKEKVKTLYNLTKI